MRSSRLALSMAIAAFAALGVVATPASAAPIALDSVLSAAIGGGEYQCRGGYPVPQCEAIEFNRSADRAFAGNGLARTAVAKDTLAGYPAIHAPEFANDGFYGNGSSWISASPNSWVKIDLGRQMRIDRVRIGRDRLGSFNDRDPGRFWIFTATEDDAYANGNGANDATEYTQQFDSQPFNANATFDWTETLAGRFDPVVARYVKVQLAADGSALDEVEIPSLADTVAPVVTSVDDITREATGPGGASVTFTKPTASDDVDGSVPVTCNKGSGDTFPLGETTVTCAATDAEGNTGTTTFDVKVEDTTAPAIEPGDDITREATDANGAAVTYTAPTATDAVDGTVPVDCQPESGSTFALGDTTVSCSATDAAGNTGSTAFKVTVEDTTGPAVQAVDDITREATSADGAAVTYSVPTATDAVDGPVDVTCEPASGGTFPIGTTTITCSAGDAAGNGGSTQFDIKVADTTAPTLTSIPDFTREATSAAGAAVTFTEPTANDAVDGTVGVTCDPSSGSTLPLGDSTVTCSATDAAGNTGTTDFKVTVVDTTGPTLTLPAPVEDATTPSGATVNFATSANDAVDGAVAIHCSRASGTTFAIGATVVSCSAQDAAGNSTTGTFTVLVRAAADQVSDLAARIKAINLKQGIYNAIDTKLQDALAALTEAKQGDRTSTCGKLGAVDNQIQSQAVVKQITQAQADELSAKVRQIRAVIGC